LARRPKQTIDLREFWRDYLLGRDRSLGIEMMTATTAYADLMRIQIEQLQLDSRSIVLDLGSGAGDFPVNLTRCVNESDQPAVIELDFVQEGLKRARERLARGSACSIRTHYAVATLEVGSTITLPIASCSASAVLGSLVLSYVEDPESLLREIRRVLVPGGRVVISSLRRDADISRIYVEGLAELPPDRVREHFGDDGEGRFAELQRRFLNDAARLLNLEEEGRFTFWDADELATVAENAGLEVLKSEMAFGDPPQAVVVTAKRI
jgi:ubiquinone/menaquinone biosynthesis C-methylase UbiE